MNTQTLITFEHSHETIAESIDQVQLSARSYIKAKPKIRAMSEKISAHLGRQNKPFFRELYSYYEDNRPAVKILDFLTYDLKELKIKYLVFFDKYTGEMGDMGSPMFSRELSDFSRAIFFRLQVEREYLIPLVRKMVEERKKYKKNT